MVVGVAFARVAIVVVMVVGFAFAVAMAVLGLAGESARRFIVAFVGFRVGVGA